MWHCLRDPIRLDVSVEHRLATDRQTYDDNIYRASMTSRDKNVFTFLFTACFDVFNVLRFHLNDLPPLTFGSKYS